MFWIVRSPTPACEITFRLASVHVVPSVDEYTSTSLSAAPVCPVITSIRIVPSDAEVRLLSLLATQRAEAEAAAADPTDRLVKLVDAAFGYFARELGAGKVKGRPRPPRTTPRPDRRRIRRVRERGRREEPRAPIRQSHVATRRTIESTQNRTSGLVA